MADRLAALLENFSISARVFHTGALCGINALEGDGGVGQLHLVREGVVEVSNNGTVAARVTEPSLLLYPRPMAHLFKTDRERGADFACANLRFAGAQANPIADGLPDFLCLPLAAIQGAEPALELLFAEAFGQNCGRQAMLDRLFEVVLIQVLRYLMEAGRLRVGLLAGMAHPRLRFALVAMHENPAEDWSLEKLAELAGMSRSVFANTFRDQVGSTPGAYLQAWRVGLVQRALLQGRPLKLITAEVGYGSEAALSRAFKSASGLSPRQWYAAQRGTTPPSVSRPPL